MSLDDFINNLQKKPYAVRLRILWITTTIIGVVLIIIWVFTIKNGVSDLNNQNLFNISQDSDQTQETFVQESNYIMVERVESTPDGAFQIFFRIENSTNDILNFSPLEQITLKVKGSNINPLQVLDRQDNPFVKKVLSNTENFGTIIFSQVEADSGTLTFNELFFEQNRGVLFREILELDFDELNKPQELRN